MEQVSTEAFIVITTVLFTLLVSFFFIYISNRRKLNDLETKLQKSESKVKDAEYKITVLNDKYSSIIDMELYAQKLLEGAENKVKANRHESERLLANAESEANNISVNSQLRAEKLVDDAKVEVINLHAYVDNSGLNYTVYINTLYR